MIPKKVQDKLDKADRAHNTFMEFTADRPLTISPIKFFRYNKRLNRLYQETLDADKAARQAIKDYMRNRCPG